MYFAGAFSRFRDFLKLFFHLGTKVAVVSADMLELPV